jgi:hypothetical protein
VPALKLWDLVDEHSQEWLCHGSLPQTVKRWHDVCADRGAGLKPSAYIFCRRLKPCRDVVTQTHTTDALIS